MKMQQEKSENYFHVKTEKYGSSVFSLCYVPVRRSGMGADLENPPPSQLSAFLLRICRCSLISEPIHRVFGAEKSVVGVPRLYVGFELVDTLGSPYQRKDPVVSELQRYSLNLSPLRGLTKMWYWEQRVKSNCDTVSVKPSEYL